MAPKMAGIQPSMSKLLISLAASFKMHAFTTNVKRPRVKKLIGNVKNKRIGRNHMLKKPITTTAHNEDQNDVILKPGTIAAVT
jgi:hypothetical protein